MRTQWTAKGNRDAGSTCSCDRGLHRYLQNFGGGFEHPKPPPSVHHWLHKTVVRTFSSPVYRTVIRSSVYGLWIRICAQ